MGYTTDFTGRFNLDRSLRHEHNAYLEAFSETRRMRRNPAIAGMAADPIRVATGLPIGEECSYFVGGGGFAGQDRDSSIIDYNNAPGEGSLHPWRQPGLWCQWAPTEDGCGIEWNGCEKFYNYTEWLQYIIDHFLSPWGYVLTGEVSWQGEEASDRGIIAVNNGKVESREISSST